MTAADPAAHSHPPDCPCVRLNERIRELEAQHADRSRKIESLRRSRDEEEARAERAEARVKVLEARLRDEHDDIPDQVELRGEDRG